MLHAGRLGRLGGEEHPSLALEAFKWAPQNQKQLMGRCQPHGPAITGEWAELRCDAPHVLAVTWRAPGRAKPSA